MNDQPAPRPQKPAPQLEHYPFRVQEIVRFGDLDPQGHVNQAVFSTYFESGRVAMFPDKSPAGYRTALLVLFFVLLAAIVAFLRVSFDEPDEEAALPHAA